MLRLVKYNEGHLKYLPGYLSNDNVARWLLLINNPYSEEDAKKWFEFCKANENSTDNYLFAIEADGKFVGGIGLHKRMEHCFDVGYWIAEKFWGKGYATEALRAITEFAFNDLKIDRIQAFVFEGNESSERVLEKCGYEYEGFLRKYHRKGNVFLNTKVYAKIK